MPDNNATAELTNNEAPPLSNRLRQHIANGFADPRAALADIEAAADELDDHDAFFDSRWEADMRAIKRWRLAHPGKENVSPDHADLVVWLMEQLDGMRLAMEGRDGA